VSRVSATRSVYSDRNTGGFYLDIVPRREALARYGLTLGEVQDVIEAAVGGQPIEVAVEGRNRFTISVRYPRDLRQDVERLRGVLIPIRTSGAVEAAAPMPTAPAPGGGGGGTMGALPSAFEQGVLLAAAAEAEALAHPTLYAAAGMPEGGLELYAQMGGMDSPRPGERPQPSPGGMGTSGAPPSSMGGGGSGMGGGGMGGNGGGNVLPPATPQPSRFGPESWAEGGGLHVPLGQVADIRVVTGPPMIRDEAGMLVGYVYVDIDAARTDIGGYVDQAKRAVEAEVKLPAGYHLKWTGQYELMQQMQSRMRLLVPLTLVIIVMLLWLNFRNLAQSMIVLVSVPFALVGSVWLMAMLNYNLSTAVWVGIIALVGLAAQTGVVMLVYLDGAYHKAKAEGRIRNLDDIVEATLEGSVQRVRPKLMTVATTVIGLAPLLWAQGSGADVMKRVAAPMVGGLFTSTFLTLEIIPVIYTYWRYSQLKREQRAAVRSTP
jgi:Cu(I)/Ag(I) efflux system membrane protein CusA/SilA